jgi:hypothetical protein
MTAPINLYLNTYYTTYSLRDFQVIHALTFTDILLFDQIRMLYAGDLDHGLPSR